MKDKIKKKKIILGILVAGLIFAGYNVFFKKSEFQPEGGLTVNQVSDIDSQIGKEIIATLNRLKTIKIDPGFFDSDLFNSLINFNVELRPEPLGKPNPFIVTQNIDIIDANSQNTTGDESAPDTRNEPIQR